MDFYEITSVEDDGPRVLKIIIKPVFRTIGIADVVIDNKEGSVRHWWNDNLQLWSDSQDSLMLQIDKELREKTESIKEEFPKAEVKTMYLDDSDSKAYKSFFSALHTIRTSKPAFDNKILFSDHTIERDDYATTKLSYRPDKEVNIDSFLEGMSVFYNETNLDKLLWFIGATLTGEIGTIQKFAYLYGKAGSGKGTTIQIIQQLFPQPYSGQISLEKLTGKSEFAFDGVRDIPVLFDPEVNLTKMTNDTPLLALTAHEPISVNRKFRDPEIITFHGFLIAASNQPVKVRNIDAGITRRLVDIYQTGDKMPPEQYKDFMSRVPSQLPGIAAYAIEKYRSMGSNYFNDYVSETMLQQTNFMYRFVKEESRLFTDPMPLSTAYEMYNAFVDADNAQFTMSRSEFQNEFSRFYDHVESGKNQRYHGIQGKVWFVGFNDFTIPSNLEPVPEVKHDLISTFNYFENMSYPAQLASKEGTPTIAWDKVTTKASDIDQSKLHFIQKNLVVIDIDGSLDETKNPFPTTYGEYSRSGNGIHYYYTYEGSLHVKSQRISEHVELKVYTGKQSIRRKFTHSNGIENLTPLSDSDLKPYFKENDMYNESMDIVMKDEAHLRRLIAKALTKQVHSATKPNVDFIEKTLHDARASGIDYNVTEMITDVMTFASDSTNQRREAVRVVQKLIDEGYFSSDQDKVDNTVSDSIPSLHDNELEEPIMFYDVESFLNVFMFSYKLAGGETKTLINPTVEELKNVIANKRLIGFNNYRYDDYILYYALEGFGPEYLYGVSQRIIDKGSRGLSFLAHELSHADIYDYSIDRKSLKAWEVELNIPYDELEVDFEAPLPEDLWDRVAQYNRNDVDATEIVFEHTKSDYDTRVMLSHISGLPVNRTTNAHATAIIFTDDEGSKVKPSNEYLEYSDLAETFPGYEFDKFTKSKYHGKDPSEGGYVYSRPGVYDKIIELDVAQLHPTSAIQLNYFGKFTANYERIVQASLALKHKDIDLAISIFPEIKDIVTKDNIKKVRAALKLVANSVYGMSSASFDNALRHPRNIDNIVAKRGSLFMITLQDILEEMGVTVVHIKTDSIKIADPTDEIINKIKEIGENYGYTFEIEATYEPFALIDKAQLIGFVRGEKGEPGVDSNGVREYHAIGKKFIDPYVHKSLFTHETFVLDDYRRTVQSRVGSLYLGGTFVGRIGAFIAATEESGGLPITMRRPDYDETGKEDSPSGTKGWLFKPIHEASLKDIDFSYYEKNNQDLISDIIKVSSEKDSLKIVPDAEKRYPDIYTGEN